MKSPKSVFPCGWSVIFLSDFLRSAFKPTFDFKVLLWGNDKLVCLFHGDIVWSCNWYGFAYLLEFHCKTFCSDTRDKPQNNMIPGNKRKEQEERNKIESELLNPNMGRKWRLQLYLAVTYSKWYFFVAVIKVNWYLASDVHRPKANQLLLIQACIILITCAYHI